MCNFTPEEENILMLANSRQIVKEINNTTQLDKALSLVVQRSKSSMDANACSVYLNDTQTDQYLLMATDGWIPGAVGKARVSRNEGLVGWVAAHEEAINLLQFQRAYQGAARFITVVDEMMQTLISLV